MFLNPSRRTPTLYASSLFRGEVISAHKHPCNEIALCSSPPCGRGDGEDTQYKESCAPQDVSSGLLCSWVPFRGHLLQLLRSNKPCPHCVSSTESTLSSAGFCSRWKRHCWEQMSAPAVGCSHIPAQHGCPSKAGGSDPGPAYSHLPKGCCCKVMLPGAIAA